MIAASILVAAVVATPTGRLKYEPTVVHLPGQIVDRRHYGPPGFGEDPKHDRREDDLLLKLNHSICVDGSHGDELKSEPERNVRELMIVPPQARLPRGPAMVAGALFHA